MRSLVAVLLSALLAATPLLAQTESASLTMTVPRTGGGAGQATIATSTVIVRPQAAHAEVSLYLTYSARDASAAPSDTLEFVHTFTLPAEASVVDSWLWMEDNTTIVRAKMLDVATASQIYENIVQRVRRDPSILFKRSATNYEFRIYPVKKDQTRRVKLTYVVPYRMTASGPEVPLPTAMLTTSRYPVTPTVIVYPETPGVLPVYANLANYLFRPATDAERGTYAYAGIPPSVRERLYVRMPRLWPTAPRLAVYPEDNGGYYALTMPLTATPQGQHVVIAINLAKDNLRTSLGAAQERTVILDALRAAMQASLTPRDSFQIVASRPGNALRVTDGWVQADTASVRAAINGIGALEDTTRLDVVLPEAIVAAQSRPFATVVLVNASDAERTFARANALLASLPASLPRIDVFDAATYNRLLFQGGKSWAGNEYLDQLLTQRSGGSKTFYAYHFRVEGMLRSGFGLLAPRLAAYDILPVNTGGASYGRFEVTPGGDLTRPYVQLGRYLGTAPTAVQGAATRGNGVINLSQSVQALPADSTLRQLWWGQELRRLEGLPADNTTVAAILAGSLRQNVLTTRSALLALDPALGGMVCMTCVDESRNPPVSTEDGPAVGEAELRAMPNPFRTTLTLRVTLATPTPAEAITAEVYDVLGRRVRALPLTDTGLLTSFTLTWDGRTEAGTPVATGTYAVVVQTPAGRLSQLVTRL